MRVVLLDPPSFTAPYDHALASALARRGHDVTLLTSPFTHGEAPEPDGYRREEVFLPVSSRLVRRAPRSKLRVPLKGAEYVPSAARLLRRTSALDPDVAHVQWLAIPRYDLHWLRRLRRPAVLTAHDVLPRRPKNARAWGEALALVDRVVVQSQRALEQLAELGVERARLVRIQHPVFESCVEAEAPTGATLLFFGLIREYKGLDVLLRALRQLPCARLVVAGDPLDPIEPLRGLAAELGVADRVEWRLGFLPDEEIPRLMHEATLVVVPYRKIDSSGVLATALGHGRPAVVTDVGGLPDAIDEFGAGCVVPPEDAAALARAIDELLGDETALQKAFEGAQAARHALTWDAAAAKHEAVYEEIRR
jgi:glycosyltransferase involved in cell wall biosynthesis